MVKILGNFFVLINGARVRDLAQLHKHLPYKHTVMNSIPGTKNFFKIIINEVECFHTSDLTNLLFSKVNCQKLELSHKKILSFLKWDYIHYICGRKECRWYFVLFKQKCCCLNTQKYLSYIAGKNIHG